MSHKPNKFQYKNQEVEFSESDGEIFIISVNKAPAWRLSYEKLIAIKNEIKEELGII